LKASINISEFMRNAVRSDPTMSVGHAMLEIRRRHAGRKFNEPSCRQAFYKAKGGVNVAPKASREVAATGNGHPTEAVAAIDPDSQFDLATIRHAKQLVTLTGSADNASALIDCLR
jgi:hypothetical protein